MIRPVTIASIIICLLGIVLGSGIDSGTRTITANSIKQAVTTHFQQALEVERADLDIEFVRLPRITDLNQEGDRFQIRSQRARADLGYQILWLELFTEDILLKKYPISARVSVLADVVIPVHNLNRGELITAEKLVMEKQFLNSGYGTQIITIEQITGLVTRRVIRAGTVIRDNMVRHAPDIQRGANVEVQLETGNLIIKTAGIAKQEGNVGDQVTVFCPDTRKMLAGIIQSSNLIIVK